jgi:hypothetical protein
VILYLSYGVPNCTVTSLLGVRSAQWRNKEHVRATLPGTDCTALWHSIYALYQCIRRYQETSNGTCALSPYRPTYFFAASSGRLILISATLRYLCSCQAGGFLGMLRHNTSARHAASEKYKKALRPRILTNQLLPRALHVIS